MQLKNSALLIIDQIKSLVEQLSVDEYTASLDLLSGNSIGKHIRHVVEFFDLLVSISEDNIINYDDRDRDEKIETDKIICINKLNSIISKISLLDANQPLTLQVSYSTDDGMPIDVQTSVNRELAYNIEHAIHHMAIIKIAVITVFPNIRLAENFGVAYSTIRYQNAGN